MQVHVLVLLVATEDKDGTNLQEWITNALEDSDYPGDSSEFAIREYRTETIDHPDIPDFPVDANDKDAIAPYAEFFDRWTTAAQSAFKKLWAGKL
jgi:hypothetical protein